MELSIGLMWLFILSVTLYDCWFAYTNRATILEWEINPVGLLMISNFGIWSALAFRVFSILFGFVVIQFADQQLRYFATCFVFLFHLALALIYLLYLLEGI